MDKQTNLMTEGNILKKIFFFSVPLILGNLFQQLYNTVDSIIVGNYVGKGALAAVGSSTSTINLLIAFSQGAAVGAGVVIAQYLGAKEKQKVEEAVHTAMGIAIALGMILTVLGIALSGTILRLMDTPGDVIEQSNLYLKIYFAGVVFNVIYNMGAGILNAAGNSKRSLIYLCYASVINIVLDLLLIRVFKMGVEGAAIATDISQIASSVFVVAYLMRTREDYKIQLKKLKIHKNMAYGIIKVGLPTGIQNMVISFSNVLVQSSVNGYGSSAVAGFGAYTKVDGFNILPVMSFSMAVTTFTGQNIGAGKIDRVKKGMWITMAMGVVYTITTGCLLLIFSEPIMRLFTQDKEVIEYGRQAMYYFCPFYFMLSIMHALAGTIRGTGKSIPPMIILLTSLCVFRVIWIILVLPHFSAIDGIFVLYPVSWAVGLVLMILYAWKGKWLPKQI
jgi:putative MATE family efflux protein